MNTRKDYQKAVRIIQGSMPALRVPLILAFIAFFTGDNPRFDAEKFAKAAWGK